MFTFYYAYNNMYMPTISTPKFRSVLDEMWKYTESAIMKFSYNEVTLGSDG